ncbi:hypothetical protein AAC387_Pa10g0117 [Persea americana]
MGATPMSSILLVAIRSPFSNLRNVDFFVTHEVFLQVCNRFPFSWKPIHRFFHFSLYKILDIYGKSSNTQLFWDFLCEMADKHLVTVSTLRVAAKLLTVAKDMKRCMEFFKLMHAQKLFDGVQTLDVVGESLFSAKLVVEARNLVL